MTGGSRADLLRSVAAVSALAGGGAALAGMARPASSASSPEQDARVFNMVLLLEDVKAAFYREALARGRLTGELRRYARTVGVHEHAHALFLRGALGAKARKPPKLDFGRATSDEDEFTAAAVNLEDIAVAAYNGQAANLTAESLKAAARIVSVEARHAAWIRAVVGKPPAAEPTDAPMSGDQVRAALERTGFLR